MNRFVLTVIAALLLAPWVHAADSSWLEQSNRNAQILLEVSARYSPEFATSVGVEGHDADVLDLKPQYMERQEADLEAAAVRFEALRAATTDSRIRQDLDILIEAARSQRETSVLGRKYLLPFFDLPQAVYSGFQNLLDSRVAKERQKDAVTRLRRYVGSEKGFMAPGQATSYYYGYSKLDALRTKVELALTGRFSEQPYHDFIIGQGLLPFDLLEKALMEVFVPAQRAN